MIVIAKNLSNKKDLCLTPGKQYKVLATYNQNRNGIWSTSTQNFSFNPADARFFITVIDDNGRKHDFWNDYFLSTYEIRLNKLNEIGV